MYGQLFSSEKLHESDFRFLTSFPREVTRLLFNQFLYHEQTITYNR